MNIPIGVVSTIVGVLVVGGGFRAAPAPESPFGTFTKEVAAAAPTGTCHLKCRACYFSTEMYEVGDNNGTHEDDYGCAWFAMIPCPTALTRCAGGGGVLPGDSLASASILPVEELWDVVAAGDANAIRRLLEYDNITFNEARGALQMTGCDGAVIAHVQLATGALGK